MDWVNLMPVSFEVIFSFWYGPMVDLPVKIIYLWDIAKNANMKHNIKIQCVKSQIWLSAFSPELSKNQTQTTTTTFLCPSTWLTVLLLKKGIKHTNILDQWDASSNLKGETIAGSLRTGN